MNLESAIKTYFVIGVGNHYLKSSDPFINFGEYELTDDINMISEDSLFESYEKAHNRLNEIWSNHYLIRSSKIPSNQLEIKVVKKINFEQMTEEDDDLDYQRHIEQEEYNRLYEPTYDPDNGSM